MTDTIAITTPTGNVGSKLAAELLGCAAERGIEVVLLARHAHSVAHWERAGVRICEGRIEEPEFLSSATRGVDALYWATPNSFAPDVTMRDGYRLFAQSAARAIKANKIAHTVHLSGFAHVDDGGGALSLLGGLAETEAALGRAVEELQLEDPGGTYGITHLRAGFFFENFLGQLFYMRKYGRIFLPVNRRRRIPMVCSHDVARRAFEILLQGGPRGRVFRGALGPEDLCFADVAAQLTEGVGRKIRVHRVPRGMIRSRMLNIGRDPRPTDAFMLVFGAINDGKVTADPPRDGASTTPTSLSRWARDVLKPLIEGVDGEVCPTRVQYEAS